MTSVPQGLRVRRSASALLCLATCLVLPANAQHAVAAAPFDAIYNDEVWLDATGV